MRFVKLLIMLPLNLMILLWDAVRGNLRRDPEPLNSGDDETP